MAANTYRIETISDLLKVPGEKRTACLREIEYSLSLHELAYGEEAEKVDMGAILWTDDGIKTVSLNDKDGPIVTLEVADEH